jgi:hypothetical protein
VGPDNKIWFSGKFNGAGGVGRMDPANPADTQGHGGYGVTGPRGIAAGPDSAIWLGDALGGSVVRIDPGTMNELVATDIPINGGNFNIRNLSQGPDGNVWVTEFGGPCQGHSRRSRDGFRRAGKRSVGHCHGAGRKPLVHRPGREPRREDHYGWRVHRLSRHCRWRSVRHHVRSRRRTLVRAGCG